MSQLDLGDFITQAIWLFHNKHKHVDTSEILRAIEKIRQDLTEEFIRQHGPLHLGAMYEREKKISKPARKRDV
jgi:hypothetical protein